MRREERVTVQGPVKEQQPDGMSHRGAEGVLGAQGMAAVAGVGCPSPFGSPSSRMQTARLGRGRPACSPSALCVQLYIGWKGVWQAMRRWAFLTRALLETRWYWEVFTMIRKLLLVFIGVFIKDPFLQVPCGCRV